MPGQSPFRSASIRWLTIAIVIVGVLLAATILFGYIQLLRDPEQARIAADVLVPGVMILSFLEIGLVVALAYRLWRIHSLADEPADEVRAGLAIALGTGVAIALGVLVLQLAVQAVADEREVRAQRENIRFTIGVSPDLTGFVAPMDPGEPTELLDMTGYWFRGKNMSVATLNDANLRGANFVFADLNGSQMRGVILTDHDGSRSDLRAANLLWVDLTGSEVGNASFVDTNLSKAYLCGVDLRNANLTGADLRGATLDVDPVDGDCEVPGQLPDEKADRACWPNDLSDEDAGWEKGCGAEARAIAAQRK